MTTSGKTLLERITNLLEISVEEIEKEAPDRVSRVILSPKITRCLLKEGVLTIDTGKKIIKDKEIGATFQVEKYLFSLDIMVSNTCSGTDGIEIILF